MKKEWFKEYSNCLNRDMEFQVYGHAGMPVLVFPAQDGRFFDFEGFKMVEVIQHLIDAGRVQLFCCDSIDPESWSESDLPKSHRSYMLEQYYYYIVNELVPRIFEINYHGNGGSYAPGIITTGCSMGATHAANFMFRRPDIFKGTIAMSGYYSSDLFFGDYHDENTYKNSPAEFIEQMPYDHPHVEMYRNCHIILCCGQGNWEEDMIPSLNRMKELLGYKNVPNQIELWGHDVAHDWPWWRIQFPMFLERMV